MRFVLPTCFPRVSHTLLMLVLPSSPHASALAQELEHLTNSFGQLKQAQAKFLGCMNDIGEMTPDTARACAGMTSRQRDALLIEASVLAPAQRGLYSSRSRVHSTFLAN